MTNHSSQGTLERLFAVGAHFAQVKSRRHPSMKRFILGAKARTEIIDLAQTVSQLEEAKRVCAALAKEGKTIMFVGGKAEVATLIRDAALRIDAPFVSGRWLGGTISNFGEIKKRIERLADLEHKRETGELAKLYTKLERVKLDREIERLSTRLAGLRSLAKLPDALLVVDTRHEAHAIKEARGRKIPVIALMSSDCNAKDATYPVVANDASRDTVQFVLRELTDAFEEGRK